MIETEFYNITDPYLYVGILGVLCLLAIKRISYLVAVYCAAFYFMNLIEINFVPLRFIIIPLLLMGLIYDLFRKGISVSRLYNKGNLYFLLFSVSLLFSLFAVSRDIDTGEQYFKSFLYYSTIPYIAFQLMPASSKAFDSFMKAFIITVVFLAIVGFSVFGAELTAGQNVGRLSLIINPISWSIPFCIAGIFCFHFFLTSASRNFRILNLLLITICFLVIFLSGTRQTIMAWIIITPTFGLLKSSRGILFNLMVAIVVVGFILYALVLSMDVEIDMDRFSELNSNDASVSYRIENLSQAFSDFYDSPVYGIGLGSWGEYFVQNKMYYKDHVHGLFMEILAEEGLIGIVFLGLFLYQTFRCATRMIIHDSPQLRSQFTVFFALFLFSITQSFGSMGIQSSSHLFWSASALIVLSNSVISRTHEFRS